MKTLKIVLAVFSLCFGTAAPSLADHHERSGHGHDGHAQVDGDGHGHGEAAEPAMPAMGAPEEMKHLAILNGDYEAKFAYKADPMAEEWTESDATASVSTTLDGAAQRMEFSGNMMGMPFEGIGVTTYDRETKKWQMMWVDSMGARISTYTGDLKDGKLVVTGKDMAEGMTFHSRLTTYNMNDKGFDWKYEMSMDGSNYMETAKATYRKK